jgi:hypothetical protein
LSGDYLFFAGLEMESESEESDDEKISYASFLYPRFQVLWQNLARQSGNAV